VLQTIFLDKADNSELWIKDEICPDKVALGKWWKQQSHPWQHHGGMVPLIMFINGKNRTQYDGAWTMLNINEIAIISGLAAMYRLNADYSFIDNKDSKHFA